MRFRSFSPVALLFLAFTVSGPLFAQFQAPTADELKMTADPKTPGAAAVYLYVEEIANDPMHYRSYYTRIKVLTEKAKGLATIELPYLKGSFKIVDIKGRTIHSDGTIVPLDVKPEELLISKTGDQQYARKVFTLPSVEVGSILEYRYQLQYDDNLYSSPSWRVQQDYPVRKAHYEFTPGKMFLPGLQNQTSMFLTNKHGDSLDWLLWWGRLPEGAKVQQAPSSGKFSLDVADIPPIPDEEWMPPIRNLMYKVDFYYTTANSGTQFWVETAKRWSKEVDHFAEESKGIREAVAGLITPTDTERQKAEKLYKAVAALENTDYTRKKTASELKQLKQKEAKHAEDTWKQKSGDSEDIGSVLI